DAKAYLKTIGMNYVVKPVGLTGGKGVKVMGEHMKCTEDAEKYIDEIFEGNIGGAGVIIEEKLEGEEFTQMVFCDGKKIVPMPLVQDHKRAYEGDMGPNTGGMGSYSMADHLLPFITAEERQKSLDIIQAVIDALAKEGCPYKGVLYGQFMLTVDGPKIIEFNARFGDPEAMNVLSILDSNFETVCLQIADGNLKDEVKFAPKATVCKYAVPKGYGTSNVESGREISFDLDNFAKSKAILYYANINMVGDEMITGTSRSAGVVGVSNSTDEAEWNCEVGLSCINCDYIAVRHDIGKASLIRKRVDHMARLRGQ
ncbi:MAG: phosphoribosylamine--glycine ligase, partial [Candidatus Methanomethylophilaceae archaeon]|nr:phosphoribosylamine--glycine ligase [Candidatus Methanomethylophilaceae archaeon]